MAQVKLENSSFSFKGWNFLFKNSGIIPSVEYE
jgi:hypothetical protein